MMMDELEFGKELKRIRKSKGLTQAELAEKSKLTIRTIQRIESGNVTPRSSTLRILSECLDYDFLELTQQNSRFKIPSYIDDLFNFKSNAMKKLSIGSLVLVLMIFLIVTAFNYESGDVFQEESTSSTLLNVDYEILGAFKEVNKDWLIVKKEDSYGLMQENRKMILPIEYTAIRKFDDQNVNWVALKKGNQYGCLDSTGKMILKVEYDAIGNFGEVKSDWSVLKKGGKYGCVDTNGNIVVPVQYASMTQFGKISQNWIVVKRNNKYGLLNRKGEEFVECKYDKMKIDGSYALLYNKEEIKKVQI